MLVIGALVVPIVLAIPFRVTAQILKSHMIACEATFENKDEDITWNLE